jgi:FMN phosphatase YigB (HAD superfamily)
MVKKIIIFDVDGVITNSWASKEAIIQKILEKHDLFHLPWVSDIFGIWLNRILLLDKIYEIQAFDKDLVLSEINRELLILESSVSLIPDTFKFIQENSEKYGFFTNTSLPKRSLQMIFSDLDLGKYFMELLAYDDGSKKENIEYVMQVYWASPEDVLFIDDKMSHINAVENTWVNTLHFIEDWVSLEEKVNSIFWK